MIRDILEFHLITIGGQPITLGTLLAAVLVLVVAMWISFLGQRAIARPLARRSVQEGTSAAIRRLFHYVVMLIAVGIALDTVGISLGALFAAGAIFAIGLGFAMQNIAQNFVSGVILLIERSIKPGDVLEVDGMVVMVDRMGIRATLVRSRDDEELIVPNSVLVQSTVKNFTLRTPLYRLRANVGVSYGSDMALVFRTLSAAAESLSWRIPKKEPVILMTGFGSSSVDFEVSVWIDDPWNARRSTSKLYDAIWWALKRADITISFPQVDVHFDPPVTQSLTGIAAVRA